MGENTAVLLAVTPTAVGLPAAMSAAKTWRKTATAHDLGKILLAHALSLAMGGDAFSDMDWLRIQPGMFGARGLRSHRFPHAQDTRR